MSKTTTEKLFHQLHRCMNLLHRGHAPHEGRGGGGAHRGQGRIISLLREKDGISQRELAEMLHIRPPSLSEVLDKLEANALIERRQNEEDKRMSNVFLTEKGRETALQVEAARQSAADTLFVGLSQEEQESLSGLLDKLITTLEATRGDAEEEERHHGGRRGERHHRHGGHHEHHHGEHHGHGHHGKPRPQREAETAD